MSAETKPLTAIVVRRPGGGYTVGIAALEPHTEQVELDALLRNLAAQSVVAVTYTDNGLTWIMDVVPFTTAAMPK